MKKLSFFFVMASAALVLSCGGKSQKASDDADELEGEEMVMEGEEEEEDAPTLFAPTTPEETVRYVFEAMMAKDFERTRDYLVRGDKEVKKLKRFDEESGGLIGYEITSCNENGNKATVGIVMKTKDVGELKDKMNLVKSDDGVWKIQ